MRVREGVDCAVFVWPHSAECDNAVRGYRKDKDGTRCQWWLLRVGAAYAGGQGRGNARVGMA
jgi:hypothetical protein